MSQQVVPDLVVTVQLDFSLSPDSRANYSRLEQHLRRSYPSTRTQGDRICPPKSGSLVIIPDISSPLSRDDCQILHTHVRKGGSCLVCLSDSMTDDILSSINFLLEELGISANDDSVIGTVFDSTVSLHPKVARIFQGTSLNYMYPHGCTLNTASPAIPFMSTGSRAYPFYRPIGVISQFGAGRVCVIGSSRMFSNDHFTTASNSTILSSTCSWLLNGVSPQELITSCEIRDYKYTCNAECLSASLLSCFSFQRTSASSPPDSTEDDLSQLFRGGSHLISEVLELENFLHLPSTPLEAVIRPRFSTVKLQPVLAIYPPSTYPSLPLQPLPLYDFDDLLAPAEIRLNRAANRCEANNDIESFTTEFALILTGTRPVSPQQALVDIVTTVFN